MLIRTLFASLVLLAVTAPPAPAVTADEAVAVVTSRYRLTKPAFFGGFNEIGTYLTPKREGLRVGRPGNAFAPTVVERGEIVTAGGGDIPLGSAHPGEVKPGERLHLYKALSGADYVQLDLFTTKEFLVQGVRAPTPLQASLRFRYPGGLEKISARQLLDDIGQWLAADEEPRSTTRIDTAPAPTFAPGSEAGSRAVASVRQGQSIAEVTAVLGKPEKEILLGPKTVFVYPFLKVIFIDSKLADAE